MCDKELTKKLLKGPLCVDCMQRRVSWDLSVAGPARYCAQFEEEPKYDVLCTCEHYVKLAPGSASNTLLSIVRQVYPSTIAGTLRLFEEFGKVYTDTVAEDIANMQPISQPKKKDDELM